MSVPEQVISIYCGVKGYLDDVELSDISEFEIKVYELCKSNNPEIIDSIKKTGKLDDEGDKNLSLLIEEFKKSFKK